jgi:hypothetical protein
MTRFSESALGSATATLRLRFGLPRDEFLRDAVRKNSSSTATGRPNIT